MFSRILLSRVKCKVRTSPFHKEMYLSIAYVYRYLSQNRCQLEMEVQERTFPLSPLGCFTEAANLTLKLDLIDSDTSIITFCHGFIHKRKKD